MKPRSHEPRVGQIEWRSTQSRERRNIGEHSKESHRPVASQYIVGIYHITRRTKNVTLPSLKKYLLCRRKESSLCRREPSGVSLSPVPPLESSQVWLQAQQYEPSKLQG